MSNGNNVHTIVNKELGVWQNKINGKLAPAEYRTQKEAIDAGKTLAMKYRAEHFIHGKDGTIKEKNSYGNDPTNVPG